MIDNVSRHYLFKSQNSSKAKGTIQEKEVKKPQVTAKVFLQLQMLSGWQPSTKKQGNFGGVTKENKIC